MLGKQHADFHLACMERMYQSEQGSFICSSPVQLCLKTISEEELCGQLLMIICGDLLWLLFQFELTEQAGSFLCVRVFLAL